MNDKNTQYPCLHVESLPVKLSCPLVAEYFAKNNKAKYGHICAIHYKHMTENEKRDYEIG